MLIAPLTVLLSVTATPASQNTRRYDNWILRRIESQFAEQGRFHNLRVEVERGIVSMRGTVKLLEDKRAAISIARSIEHVRGTISHIKVDTIDIPDKLLQRQLQTKTGQPQFQNIDVRVRMGVVTITGLIGDPVDRESTISLIASTEGVRAIDNRLRLRSKSPVS